MGLDFITNPFMAMALSVAVGLPIWFVSAYVYSLIQDWKDSSPATILTAKLDQVTLVVLD